MTGRSWTRMTSRSTSPRRARLALASRLLRRQRHAGLAQLAGTPRDHAALQAGAPRGLPAHRRRARHATSTPTASPRTSCASTSSTRWPPARGWRNKLRLMVDDEYPPATLDLPHWGLRAEFWIEGAGDDYGTDTNETGAYLYLTTDQVRFYRWTRRKTPPTRPAAAIGAGVATTQGTGRTTMPSDPAGADPAARLLGGPARCRPLRRRRQRRQRSHLAGRRPGGRYRDYWQSYSFGDLSATAETARAAPRAPDPAADDRRPLRRRGALPRVRGDLRTYKIHLGSGNILMEPNDQYLCIVPSRGGRSRDGEPVPAVRGRRRASRSSSARRSCWPRTPRSRTRPSPASSPCDKSIVSFSRRSASGYLRLWYSLPMSGGA